jgi:spoIIIJ-associated protein
MANQDAIETIKTLLTGILIQMGIAADIEVEDSATSGLVFNIHTQETQLLIGRQGSHLHALQVVLQQMAIKNLGYGNVPWFVIDVDDYRRKREWYLKEMARTAIEKAKRIGKPVTLEPMPNYERRLIHSYIQEHFADVTTESIGEGSSRRINIIAK